MTPPVLRSGPLVNYELILKKPHEYYDGLGKEELIRKLMLGKMQRSEYTEGRNQEIRAWVEEHPEIKTKIEERIRNVPAQQRERAFINAARTEAMNQTVRSNGVRRLLSFFGPFTPPATRRMLAAPTFACEFEQVTSALRIPFAWSDRLHLMVSSTEVERGWECGCTCKGCGARVQARQGAKNRHHFAHLGDAECSGGLETSIHFTAKQIIEAEKKLWLPAAIAFPFYPHNMRPIRAVKAQMLTVERVEVEASLNDIRPDLILWKKGRPLAVEIEVTRPVDESKAQAFENMGVSALAINLRAVARSISIEELRTRLMSPSTDTRWVFNRMADSLASTFRRETVKRSLTWRTSHKRAGMIPHVDSCPLRPRESKRHQSTFANAKLDCPGCPYYFPPENPQRIYSVRCSGHLAAQYPEAISEDWLHRIDGGD